MSQVEQLQKRLDWIASERKRLRAELERRVELEKRVDDSWLPKHIQRLMLQTQSKWITVNNGNKP